MHSRDYPAIIDSGAEYTSVPVELVDDFELEQCGDMPVSGTTGEQEIQGIYEINVEFLGLAFPLQPCLAGTGPITRTYVLVGRDILNRYRLVLDGPNFLFTIE
jgi:predicted aspartyl protease